MDKWVPKCSTVDTEYLTAVDVFELNSMINHSVRNMILSRDGMSSWHTCINN